MRLKRIEPAAAVMPIDAPDRPLVSSSVMKSSGLVSPAMTVRRQVTVTVINSTLHACALKVSPMIATLRLTL